MNLSRFLDSFLKQCRHCWYKDLLTANVFTRGSTQHPTRMHPFCPHRRHRATPQRSGAAGLTPFPARFSCWLQQHWEVKTRFTSRQKLQPATSTCHLRTPNREPCCASGWAWLVPDQGRGNEVVLRAQLPCRQPAPEREHPEAADPLGSKQTRLANSTGTGTSTEGSERRNAEFSPRTLAI